MNTKVAHIKRKRKEHGAGLQRMKDTQFQAGNKKAGQKNTLDNVLPVIQKKYKILATDVDTNELAENPVRSGNIKAT
ncbi:MAG: hypothetical protein ABIN89_11215 [Chitinophagaceae bacterium]